MATVYKCDGCEIKVDIEMSFLGAWSWKEVGRFTCPGCKHNVTFYSRHVGFIIGGHRQLSCGCRLARRSEEARGIKSNICGCEFTKNDEYGPIHL